MFETAASITSQQSLGEKENFKFNSNHFLKFIVDEICNNNYKITQILEKFRATFFYLNPELLQEVFFFESDDEEKIKSSVLKIINELEEFLFDPLKDFIMFFYSIALEKIVYFYLGQDSHFMNLFLIDIIHHLVFKVQNKFYNIISNILTLSSKKECLTLERNMMENKQFSLFSLLENQDFVISRDILLQIEEKNFFEGACVKIRSISEMRTPLKKLELLGQIHLEIMNSLEQINDYYKLNINLEKAWKKFDADHIISFYCYLIVKSNHYDIFKEIQFIENFIGKRVEHTQWEYYYENLKSAVDYILTWKEMVDELN